MHRLRLLTSLLLTTLALLSGPLPAAAADDSDPVLQALELELARSMELLAAKEQSPYFIGLEVIEVQSAMFQAEEGALHGYRPSTRRWVHADVRLGNPRLDSTHPLRDSDADYSASGREMGSGEDVGVLRRSVWREVEQAYRESRERLQQVQADRQVLVEETGSSWDLAPLEPVVSVGDAVSLHDLDLESLEDAVRQASEVFTGSVSSMDPSVSLSAEAVTQWFVSSEGHRLRHGTMRFRMGVSADTIAADGDHLQIYEAVDTAASERLPDGAALTAVAQQLEAQLVALREAPREQPYSGPAIVSGKAAAVFFHEIFGHRVEGSRLKQVDSGQTFLHRVGESILPSFLSVHDDPTLGRYGGVDLRGSYAFDNQGVPTSRVTLVDNGVLKGFLESRSPTTEDRRSNAHGRRQAGRAVVARQGNLLVSASETITDAQLRKQLRALARKAGLDYGLYIEDISGGFTFTGTYMPNAYQINVLLAHRIYVDGRPDELVRGIDFIGTPLQTFSKIVAAGDSTEVFNGSCGAESGWVPVSAAAPPLLISQVEAQRQLKGQAKSPLLPPPGPTPEGPAADRLLGQLVAATERATEQLSLPGAPRPAWTEIVLRDLDRHMAVADFGALRHRSGAPSRPTTLEVVVGSEALNSSRISGGSISILPSSAVEASLVVEDRGENPPRDYWLIGDHSYKAALQRYAFKVAARAQAVGEAPPADLTAAAPVVHVKPRVAEPIPEALLDEIATSTSAALRGMGLLRGTVQARTIRGNEYLVRSDGTQVVQPYGYTAIWATASVARADGLQIGDHRQWLARSEADLPSIAEMSAEVAAMGASLAARIRAEPVPYYEGPVLFEGRAASQLFVQLLPPSLLGTPPVPEPGKSYLQQTRRGPRLNRQVLPAGWHVVDDPSEGHRSFPGGYVYDQEGVPGQRATLVRDGRVVDFVMSRVPRADRSGSNGHARGGVGGQRSGRLTNWEVSPARSLGDAAFTRAVNRSLRSAGVDRILVIRELGRTKQGSLPVPTDAIWRHTDGREEPVLLLEFQGVGRRTLRDIAAASSVGHTMGYLGSVAPRGRAGATSGMPMVVTTPARVLVEHLEVAYPGASQKPFAIEPPPLEQP